MNKKITFFLIFTLLYGFFTSYASDGDTTAVQRNKKPKKEKSEINYKNNIAKLNNENKNLNVSLTMRTRASNMACWPTFMISATDPSIPTISTLSTSRQPTPPKDQVFSASPTIPNT